MSKTLKQLREVVHRYDGDLYQRRWDEPHKVRAAVRYKGKVYTGMVHGFIIDDMVKKHGFSEAELDKNLGEKNFGFTVNGRFTVKEPLDYNGIRQWLAKKSTVKEGLYNDRFDKTKNTLAAVRYRNELCTAETHGEAVLELCKKFKPEELDAQLSDKNFGYMVNGKFVEFDMKKSHTFSDFAYQRKRNKTLVQATYKRKYNDN